MSTLHRWLNLTLRHSWPGETPADVVKRVLKTVGLDNRAYADMLLQGRFLPAGRTLKTAQPNKGVTPNCTVLEPDLDAVRQCMRQSIGVGVCLDDIADPVALMHKIGTIPPADETGRKPGIMIALDWKHPRALDVCRAKLVMATSSPLFNMNVSLRIDEKEWSRFEASDTFVAAVEGAFACGDPGLLIRRADERGKCTSPCGELWLVPNEVCNLGNVNLMGSLAISRVQVRWDEEAFASDVRMALVFLEQVRHHLAYPLGAMRDVSNQIARLGLGVMGFADLLNALKIKYDSDAARQLADKIGRIMKREAEDFKKGAQRQVLTLAPTGGTSLIVGASFSIEPHFREAHKINPSSHVMMQSIWQKHIDNGVSKTVNLPCEATLDDVANIYRLAFSSGCKGITVYRDGCRSWQPIETRQ